MWGQTQRFDTAKTETAFTTARKVKKLKLPKRQSIFLDQDGGARRAVGFISGRFNDRHRGRSGKGGRYGLDANSGLRHRDGGPQELLARNEYLAAENRILKAQLKGTLIEGLERNIPKVGDDPVLRKPTIGSLQKRIDTHQLLPGSEASRSRIGDAPELGQSCSATYRRLPSHIFVFPAAANMAIFAR